MGSNFLPVPFPERLYKMSIPQPRLGENVLTLTDNPMLSVGLQVITKDHGGLSVVPHKAVVIAMGSELNPEQHVWDLPLSFARVLAERLIEFADAAEASNAA